MHYTVWVSTGTAAEGRGGGTPSTVPPTMTANQSTPSRAQDVEGTEAELNTRDDVEALTLELNGEQFGDVAYFSATPSTFWAGEWEPDGPHVSEVSFEYGVPGMMFDASLYPSEARRLAAQLVEAADRADREARRRNEQFEIAQEDREE